MQTIEDDDWAYGLEQALSERRTDGDLGGEPELDLVNVRIPRPSRVPSFDFGFAAEPDPFHSR